MANCELTLPLLQNEEEGSFEDSYCFENDIRNEGKIFYIL